MFRTKYEWSKTSIEPYAPKESKCSNTLVRHFPESQQHSTVQIQGLSHSLFSLPLLYVNLRSFSQLVVCPESLHSFTIPFIHSFHLAKVFEFHSLWVREDNFKVIFYSSAEAQIFIRTVPCSFMRRIKDFRFNLEHFYTRLSRQAYKQWMIYFAAQNANSQRFSTSYQFAFYVLLLAVFWRLLTLQGMHGLIGRSLAITSGGAAQSGCTFTQSGSGRP